MPAMAGSTVPAELFVSGRGTESAATCAPCTAVARLRAGGLEEGSAVRFAVEGTLVKPKNCRMMLPNKGASIESVKARLLLLATYFANIAHFGPPAAAGQP